jgi:hypothetical protein
MIAFSTTQTVSLRARCPENHIRAEFTLLFQSLLTVRVVQQPQNLPLVRASAKRVWEFFADSAIVSSPAFMLSPPYLAYLICVLCDAKWNLA